MYCWQLNARNPQSNSMLVAQLPGHSRSLALRCRADNLVAKKQWYRAVALSKCPLMKVNGLQGHLQCLCCVCCMGKQLLCECMAYKVLYLIQDQLALLPDEAQMSCCHR